VSIGAASDAAQAVLALQTHSRPPSFSLVCFAAAGAGTESSLTVRTSRRCLHLCRRRLNRRRCLRASVLPDQRAWPCPYPLQPCPQNCQACDENGRCLQCQQGTGLNTRHQCVPCADRLCVQCLGNYKRCTQCMSTGAGSLDHYPNAKGECRRVRDNAASSVTATGPAAKEAKLGATSHLAQCNMPLMQAWCASRAAVRGGRLRLVSRLHNAGAVQSLFARLHA
jgi:hypothetical protein